MKPDFKRGDIHLYHGDCLDLMPEFEDSSVSLILTDPPYFKIKGESWDRQWDKPEHFLSWIGKLCALWYRLLPNNGSLYCFASPKMAARVECKIAELFDVLNRIRWVKEEGWHKKAEKEILRSYLSPWEEIIFAEHANYDSREKGEGVFVFEPLREYLDSERDKAGWTTRQVAAEYQKKTGSRTVTGMAGHWFDRVQWCLPTEENYEWLRALFNYPGDKKEYLRRDYEDLCRDYEDLRRPFSVSSDVPYTDVWTFPTVKPYPGKHPCEKPLAMMEHVIKASSREGDVVLDPFLGSGTTGVAAIRLNRKFIGIEKDEKYFDIAVNRILTVEGVSLQ